MTRRAAWFLVICLMALGPGCTFGDDDDEDVAAIEQSAQVTAFDFYFEPATLVFEPETRVTVEFENAGDNTHSFTVEDLDIEVEAPSGESNTLTFVVPDGPGPYMYFCEYHPDEMRGSMSVEAEVGDDNEVDVDVDVDDEDDADTDADVEVDDTGEDEGATNTTSDVDY